MSFILALCISMSVMLCAWFVYLYTKNPGVVDVFWGISIFAVGTFYLYDSSVFTHAFIPQVVLFLWAIRLSLFLLITRVLKGKRETRYDKLKQHPSNQSLGFLYHFLFQAILAFVIGLPFYFMGKSTSFGLLQYAAVVIVLIGLIGETIADITLYQFTRQKTNKVCEVGLWHYSRHPNYFFECLIWLGFSLMGVTNFASLLSVLSVITLFCIMKFITIPITEEQSIAHRGDKYLAYQKQVSCFFPWIR